MASNRTANGTRLVTPLVVISLFVTLTEVAMSIAATKTTGFIQGMFATFAVVFAIAVASAFFYTLWRRPWVLYHPGEYGQQDVGRYVEAMQHRRADEVSVDSKIQHSLRTVFTDEVLTALKALPETTNLRAELQSVVEKATDRAVADIRKSSFLTFDLRGILGEDIEPWVVPYERFTSLTDMLDELWFKLEGAVPSHTYGQKWALRDPSTGKLYRDMGRRYANRVLGTEHDNRPLSVADIHPGMILEPVLLQPNA